VVRDGEIAVGRARLVRAGGADYAVFNLGSRYCAILNSCPHRGGSLKDGQLREGRLVECPVHSWTFDLDTGRSVRPVADQLRTEVREVRVQDGDLIIET
jgi:nitrite reductase/ring-hydroxylating ferredoxin subunit